jgi:hypothetical protein
MRQLKRDDLARRASNHCLATLRCSFVGFSSLAPHLVGVRGAVDAVMCRPQIKEPNYLSSAGLVVWGSRRRAPGRTARRG